MIGTETRDPSTTFDIFVPEVFPNVDASLGTKDGSDGTNLIANY